MLSDTLEAHHREVGEREKQLGPGSRHLGAAEADDVCVGLPRAEGANQIRPVQIAARFASAEEQLHAGVLAAGEQASSLLVYCYAFPAAPLAPVSGSHRNPFFLLAAWQRSRFGDAAVAERAENLQHLAPRRERAAVLALVPVHRLHELGFVVVVVALAGRRVDEPAALAVLPLVGGVLRTRRSVATGMFRFRRSFGKPAPLVGADSGVASGGVASGFVIGRCLSAGRGVAGSQAAAANRGRSVVRSEGTDGY